MKRTWRRRRGKGWPRRRRPTRTTARGTTPGNNVVTFPADTAWGMVVGVGLVDPGGDADRVVASYERGTIRIGGMDLAVRECTIRARPVAMPPRVEGTLTLQPSEPATESEILDRLLRDDRIGPPETEAGARAQAQVILNLAGNGATLAQLRDWFPHVEFEPADPEREERP